MTTPGRGRLLIVGALVALPILAAAPPAQAAPRETRPLFSLPKQLRMPWSQPAKPVRRQPRRSAKAAKPPAVAAAAAAQIPPLPRPAPEPKIAATTPDADPEVAARPEATPPPGPPPAVETDRPPEPPTTAPPDTAIVEDDAAASGLRAADFAGLRPTPPEAPPLAPLPSRPEPEEPRPSGPIARGVPLPPVKIAAPEVAAPPAPAPETTVAMMPRAPLDGPPLPGPPDADTPPPVVAPPPSARAADPECARLVREGVAIAKPLPPLLGPASCGAPLPVELTGVNLADGAVVAIEPAAILRCETARAVAAYVRDDLAPAAAKSGPALTRVRTAASYICRGRNNRAFAKMSEHGLANALDISGFGFAGGKELGVYDKALPQGFSSVVKSAACARFATVLGPGSDGLHEDHLHVDLRKRRNANSKLCRWSGS